MVQTSVPEYVLELIHINSDGTTGIDDCASRLYEDDAHSVIDVRTDSLQTLRELGPPDLVHFVRQATKSSKQVLLPSLVPPSCNG